MAPEQAEGRTREVGPAADVYALGAILYELLTGRPPFRAATVAGDAGAGPVGRAGPAVAAVSRAAARPGDDLPEVPAEGAARATPRAEALADDLRRFLAGEPILARPVGHVERLWRWCRRNRVVAALAALVALLLVMIPPGTPGGGLANQAGRGHAVDPRDTTSPGPGLALERPPGRGSPGSIRRQGCTIRPGPDLATRPSPAWP